MFDFLKSFWDKANGMGGGFTPKGIIIRLGISIVASLIASVVYTTFIRSDESDNQSTTPIASTLAPDKTTAASKMACTYLTTF